MADLTPALARASAAIDDALRNAEAKDYDAVMHGEPHEGITSDDLADIALSAALHDPDDPDWLARAHDEHRRISPAHMDTSQCSCGERFATQWRWCQHVARAVRAAILGEGVLMTPGREA